MLFLPRPARRLAAALVLLAVPARGQDACRRAVPVAAAHFLDRSFAVLAGCQARIASGALPAGTDCDAEVRTSHGRAAAGAALARRIRAACTARAAAAVGLGGDCAGTRTVAGLVACVRGSHDAAAATTVGVADATSAELAAPGRVCQAAASRAVRTFMRGRLAVLQRCKRRPPSDLTPGTTCTAERRTTARIDRLRADAARVIVARCQGSALAGARFGAPCAAPASADGLAQCLLAAADTAADDALAAEFRDGGFCGDAARAVAKRIDRLLASMTLDDKLAQVHGSTFRDHAWRTASNDALGIPGLGMIDGPRGVSFLAGNATTFPVAIARGATWDPALEERVGEAIGDEARARGASVLLAPVLNIVRHPRGGRTQETYGEDPLHLGRMGVGFIRGAQQHVIASPKHFAANNIENTRVYTPEHSAVNVTMDERTLREIYLPHFRMAVEQAHAGSIMAAYNQVNGQYCAENFHLLHDVLKGDWGFPGFVESDWFVAVQSTVPSIRAGLDIEMPLAKYYGKPLADAVAKGDVTAADIDAAVRRILRAQLCFRLDSDPPTSDPSRVETPAHDALALEVARESIVLLKNTAAALPLDRTRVASIVVVGALAPEVDLGDMGSSFVIPSAAVAPLDGIRNRAGSIAVTHLPAAPVTPDERETVISADAAIVVAGLTADDEGEGQITPGDRTTLVLPGQQDDLIATVAALNPRTIVVLEGSGPVTMPWVNDAAAILMAWYPGQEGGNAIADVLFGDVTPSGKLPLTFPRAEADIPPFDNQSLEVTYGYFHGYRHVDRQGIAPLFPFGFGLSYTTFAYSNLTIAPAVVAPEGRVRVTADVTNTGGVAGDEVVQLYVGAQGSRVDRAVRDLRGFSRVHLEPGGTRTVTFELRAAELAFWDVVAGGWMVEPLTYAVGVGRSSRDLPLAGSFAVAASAAAPVSR